MKQNNLFATKTRFSAKYGFTESKNYKGTPQSYTQWWRYRTGPFRLPPKLFQAPREISGLERLAISFTIIDVEHFALIQGMRTAG
jgi:hypothetical protein